MNFESAKDHYTIDRAWRDLDLPGEPHRSCRCPWREDRHPSFSIFDEGRAWKDHATGQGGDVVEFLKLALDTDYAGVSKYFAERFGGSSRERAVVPQRRVSSRQIPTKAVRWPSEVTEGMPALWDELARHRGLSLDGVRYLVDAGLVRFSTIRGRNCFVVTDESRRAAEIREIKGGLFFGRKAFPLEGVDKSWLPGIDRLRGASPETSVFITEGATDLLAVADLYVRYRKDGGTVECVPAALLGASCKTLSPDAAAMLRGRRIRIAPDGDPAGDQMAEHWRRLLLGLGCTVEVVLLPRGHDLSSLAGELEPEGLFE